MENTCAWQAFEPFVLRSRLRISTVCPEASRFCLQLPWSPLVAGAYRRRQLMQMDTSPRGILLMAQAIQVCQDCTALSVY